MIAALNDPQVQEANWLEAVAAEPALVQLIVVAFGVTLLGALGLRAARRVREMRERAGTRDFLLGTEQALVGDVQAAHRRLDRVLRDDPSNTAARLLRAELATALGQPAAAHRDHVALSRAFGSRSRRNQNGLARALLDAGRPAEAVDATADAAREGDRDALRIRFTAQLALGRDREAATSAASLAARLQAGSERDEVRDAAAGAAERSVAAALDSGRGGDAIEAGEIARRAAGDAHPAVQRIAARLRAAAATGLAEATAVRFWDLRLRPLASAGRALDAIVANEQHLERLCQEAEAGDRAARDELIELGPVVAERVLDAALRLGPEAAIFGEVVRGIGVPIVPALIAAWAKRRAAAPGDTAARERATATLSAMLRALGPSAGVALEPYLADGDRELRKALVDWHLALGDVDAFSAVVDALPPVEVVQRLNEVEDELLVPFLEQLPEGHFILDILLPEGGFTRDVAVLEAIPAARAPRALEQLLVHRGFGPTIASALIERLADRSLGPIAARVLDAFGERAYPALVLAFADVERDEAQRRAIAERLVAAGSGTVAALCRCFGSAAAPLDRDVVELLARLGDVAIPELRDGYRQGGLLERLAGALARRRTHRREMLVRTLGMIGTLAARTALAQLRERETDTDLSLRIAQAMHRIDDATPRLGTSTARRDEPGDRQVSGG